MRIVVRLLAIVFVLLASDARAISFTEEERRWIDSHVVRVGVEEWAPYIHSDRPGHASGVGGDYLNKVVEKTGLKIEVVSDLWDTLLTGLREKTIDLLPLTYHTDERATYGLYSRPFFFGREFIYVREENEVIRSIDDLAEGRIAVVKGYGTIPKLKERYPQATIVETPDLIASINAVLNGDVDALMEAQMAVEQTILDNAFTGLRGISQSAFKASPMHFFSRIDEPVLAAILQKGLDAITDDERAEIHRKWFSLSGEGRSRVRLTPKERFWLSMHPEIRLGVDIAWPPFEFVEEGRYKGIGSSYVQLLSKQLDLALEPALDLPWAEVIEKTKRGELDLLPAVMRTPDREAYLNFTRPYIRFPMVLATRKDRDTVGGLDDLHGRKVGVVKGYVTEEILRREQPKIELVPAANLAESLQALADGRLDAVFDNLAVITHQIDRMRLDNVRIAAPTPYDFELAMGVRKDWPELVAIIDKVVASVDERERAAIRNSWLAVEVTFGTDVRTILLWAVPIAVVIAAIIALIVWWNRKLGREIAERRRVQEALARERELLRAVLDSIQQGLVAYDKDLRLITCNRRFREIRGVPEELTRPGTPFADWIRHDVEHGEFGHGDPDELFRHYLEQGRLSASHHFERVRPDGTVIQVSGSGLPGGGFVSTFTDVTEGKAAERRQRSLLGELEFQKFALDQHAIVSATDVDGTITYVNDLFCRISGFGRDELLGQNHRKVSSGVHPRTFFATLWNTILDGKVWHGEVCNRAKEGSLYWVHATVVPFLDKDGQIQQFISIRTDITERRRNEDRVVRALASQSLFKQLLTLSIQDQSLDGLMDRALALILDASFIDLQHRGGIFLINGELGDLEMVAHSGMEPRLLDMCRKVPFGHCLCGRVADSGELLFAEHTDERHESECRDQTGHGHYCVPIRSGQKKLGVLNLYMPSGHMENADDQEILHALGNTLGLIVERKEAEVSLLAATEKLRDAQRLISMGSWERDLTDNSAQWSDEVFEILGRPFQARASFEQALECIHPEDREHVVHTVETSIRSGTDCVVEYRIVRPDGGIRHIYSKGHVTRRSEPDGRPLRMAGTILDITERKNNEERIARALENQSLLKQLLALSIQDATLQHLLQEALKLILDASFVAVLGQGAVFLRRARGGGLEMVAQQGLHPHLLTACRTVADGHCLCGRVAVSGEILFVGHVDGQHDVRFAGMDDHGHYCVPIRSGEALLGVLTLYIQAGHRENVEERGLLQAIGNTLGMIVERKHAEQELLKLSAAVQHSPVSVLVTDPDGTIEYVNDRFTAVTGYAPHEALGRKTSLLSSGKTDSARYRELWTALLAGESWQGRFLNRRKSGDLYWQQLSIAPVKDSRGQTTSFVSVGEDISEQIRLLEERDEAMHLVNGSIQYASHIQRSILPRREVLEDAFADFFVLWEPRDVVGGDMYWLRSWGRGTLFLLGDCTGHGVPGAFMTLISNGALDEAYLETPPGDPATLLQRMHQLIQSSLGQDQEDGGGSDDGIELGACYINANRTTLIFAGARFDLFVLEDGEVAVIKGVRAGLGYRDTPRDIRFSNHEVGLSSGQTFYMTSDGLIDQVGGAKRRGFGKRRFMELLASLSSVPVARQGQEILLALTAYQGKEKRRDDLSVVGFRIPAGAAQRTAMDMEELDPALMVGFGPIDEDHRRLVSLVGKLNEAIIQGHDKSQGIALLDGLISYTQWHFRHEERLMQVSGYPGTAQHRKEHQHLVGQVLKIQRELKQDDANVSSDLMLFLLDWLNVHIHQSDQLLADHLNGQGVHDDGTQDYFVLDDSLMVGYPAIDDDHRKLVDLVNQLHVATRDGSGRQAVEATLVELVDYTSWHFRHEERLMQTSDYPGMENHKEEHGNLIARIQRIRDKFGNDDEEAPAELNALIKTWLINHIYEVDKKFAAFLTDDGH